MFNIIMNFEIHYFDKCVACQTCIIIVGCMSNSAKWDGEIDVEMWNNMQQVVVICTE